MDKFQIENKLYQIEALLKAVCELDGKEVLSFGARESALSVAAGLAFIADDLAGELIEAIQVTELYADAFEAACVIHAMAAAAEEITESDIEKAARFFSLAYVAEGRLATFVHACESVLEGKKDA